MIFIKGEIDTNFIDNFYKGGYKGTVKNEFQRFYIGLLAFLYKINYLLAVNKNKKKINAHWIVSGKESETSIIILKLQEDSLKIKINNKIYNLSFEVKLNFIYIKMADEKKYIVGRVLDNQSNLTVFFRGKTAEVIVLNKTTYDYSKKIPQKEYELKKNLLLSPMPGKVIEVIVKEGELVNFEQSLIILDAMKMENILKSEIKGKVKKVHVNKGDSVSVDQALITFE